MLSFVQRLKARVMTVIQRKRISVLFDGGTDVSDQRVVMCYGVREGKVSTTTPEDSILFRER